MEAKNSPETCVNVLGPQAIIKYKLFLKKWGEKTSEVLEIIDQIDEYFKAYNDKFSFITYDLSQNSFFEINQRSLVNSDIVDFLTNRKGILIFESTEGEHQSARFPEVLYHTIIDHGLDTRQMHFITGSHYPKTPYSDMINVHFIPLLLKYTIDQNLMHMDSAFSRTVSLENNYREGNYYSALSQNKRTWRTWAVYNLLHSKARKYGLISYNSQQGSWSFPEQNVQEYMKNVNLAIPGDPFNNLTDQTSDEEACLYHQKISPVCYDGVLFHINMETHQDDYGCVFYTEKTAKPLCAEVPFITWGAPGMNTKHFSDLGFEPYTDWFDFSFDSEIEPKKRWYGLQQEVERACDEISKMSKNQQIAWSTQNQEVLRHNKRQVIKLCEEQIIKFCRQLFDSLDYSS